MGRLPPPSGAAVAALVAGAALLARSILVHGWLAAVVNGFDLVVHEAGHPLAALLGFRFLTFLGGTLAQLAVPAAAAALFLRQGQTASFGAALTWLGASLVDVGRYAADGEARALPLLAADASQHDWWNMLGQLGVRHHASLIGGSIGAAGWVLLALGPAWCTIAWLRARLDATPPEG